MSVTRVAVLAWLFLVGASIATLLLVEGHRVSVPLAVALAMGIAALKVRVIALHYMELKHAPLNWRLAFELWPVLVSLLILGLWFLAGLTGNCAPA